VTLRDLAQRGIRVLVRGDRLSLRGPEDVLTPDLTEHLKQHKPQILEAVRQRPTCCECGAAILELPAWWGGDPVHLHCGRRAWAREWKGECCRPTRRRRRFNF
jgi:hypothetical protein